MGLYTFFLYMLIFVLLQMMEEREDAVYGKTEYAAAVGLLFDLLLWVCAALGAFSLVFRIYCWLSFLFFSVVYFRFVTVMRRELRNRSKN